MNKALLAREVAADIYFNTCNLGKIETIPDACKPLLDVEELCVREPRIR